VSRDRLTGLITMHIEWRDPVQAANWANLLVQRVNEEMRSRAIAKSTASLGFLENELVRSSAVETRQAINRLIEGQINQRMLANVTQEYAFRTVDRALPPDSRDRVRPNKPLLLLFGAVVGFFLGVFVVLVKSAFGSRPARSES
jgi:LPS O-antigen subunit length determinant protein (WzzB/FepE family)